MKLNALITLLILSPLALQAQDWGSANLRDVGRDEEGLNWIAIELELNEGWKTYWQYAGQNGLDPAITLSQNETPIEAQIHWPEPHLFLTDGLPAIGYKGDLLIPISFRAEGNVDIEADIGVCQTQCAPALLEFKVNAQNGYSIEQYILKGLETSPEPVFCSWDFDTLKSLDANKYYLFIEQSGDQDSIIEHQAPEEFNQGAIYALSEDEITPIECS